MHRYPYKAFSLVEVLITLVIVAVIAMFTVPKVLGGASNDDKFNTITRDAAYAVYSAYQMRKMEGTLSSTDSADTFAAYLNYVKKDTTLLIDDYYQWGTTQNCSVNGLNCYVLHNGAVVMLSGGAGNQFGGTASTNAVMFMVDPDGKVTTNGTTNSPGKSVQLYMYFDGRVRDRGTITPRACFGGTCYNPDATTLPPWYKGLN